MILLLDTFPTSCVAKRPSKKPTLSDQCRQWIDDCENAGHTTLVPAIAYYEALRELEQRLAKSQIERPKSRFVPSDLWTYIKP
ncbi:MAG TPA: hypothetical protein VKU00_16625 [Chthonomonadaceae bacterium]|nr:hypothetical protein [Chthonomonadaceae bacterium]